MITGIKVGQNWLTMHPATPAIRRGSPLFQYGVVPALVTYPFTIDYEANARFLDFPAKAAVINSIREYECQILFFNCWLVKGSLKILRTNGKQIEILVGSPFYDITNELFKKKITELSWEDYFITSSPQIYIDVLFEEIGPGPYPPDSIVFNTGYAEYTYNSVPDEYDYIITNAIASLINADASLSGISAEVIGDKVRIKQVELGPHNKVFNTAAMSFASLLPRFTLTPDFKSWLGTWHNDLAEVISIIATSNGFYPAYPIQFITQYNPDHYGNLNPDFNGFINMFDEDTLQINYKGAGSFSGNKFSIGPSVFYFTVLDKILEHAGLRMVGEAYEDTRLHRCLIDNNYTSGKEWYDPIEDWEILAFSDRVHYQDVLPDMTVGDFINQFCNKFNLWISGFEDGARTITLAFRDSMFNDLPVVDFSNVPVKGLPIHDFNIFTSLKFTSPQDAADQASGIYFTKYNNQLLQHTDYQIGLGEKVITSLWSFPSVQSALYITLINEAFWIKCPIKKCAGSGDEWGGRRNAFSPRLLIYVGWEVGTNGNFYSYATNDHLDSLNEDDGLNISLIWPKTYELFWNKWGAFEAASKRRVTIKLALTVDQYIQFRFDRWFRLLEAHWLPVESEVVDGRPGMVLTEITFQKKDSL